MRRLIYDYCTENWVDVFDVLGDDRSQNLVRHRVRIARKARRNGFTMEQIGKGLRRHHSTIIHYLHHTQLS